MNMKLDFFAGVEYNDKIFFSSFNVNGLFVYDIKTQETKYLKAFEKEKMKKCLHRVAFVYGNEAWFIPQEGEYISCVDLDTLEIEYHIPLFKMTRCSFQTSSAYHLYSGGYVYNKRFLYLIPVDIDTISVIDMETHKIKAIYEIKDMDKEKISSAIVVNDELWMVPGIGNKLNILDLNSKRIRKIKWDYSDYSYNTVVFSNGKLWFAPYNSETILSLDIKTNEISMYEIENPNNKYSGILELGDYLIFFSIVGKDFIIINSLTLEMSTDYFEDYRRVFYKQPNKISIVDSADKNILTTGETSQIIIYGNIPREYRILHISDDICSFSKEISKSFDDIVLYDEIIKEYNYEEIEEIISLEGYIKMIINHK